MKSTLVLSVLVAVLAFSSPAFAKKGERGHMQKQRIKEGVKSGELTRDEVRDIRQDRKKVHEDLKAKRDAAKADGTVTKEERKAIQERKDQGLDHVSDKIHDLKNNDKERDTTESTAPNVD